MKCNNRRTDHQQWLGFPSDIIWLSYYKWHFRYLPDRWEALYWDRQFSWTVFIMENDRRLTTSMTYLLHIFALVKDFSDQLCTFHAWSCRSIGTVAVLEYEMFELSLFLRRSVNVDFFHYVLLCRYCTFCLRWESLPCAFFGAQFNFMSKRSRVAHHTTDTVSKVH